MSDSNESKTIRLVQMLHQEEEDKGGITSAPVSYTHLMDAESGGEDENVLLSEKFGSLLTKTTLSWSDKEDSGSFKEIVGALEQLELTMLGIKVIHSTLVGLGSPNPQLNEVVERGIRLEREMFMANLLSLIHI